MAMRTKDFGVFILTHGRADRVFTYQTLRDFGYTGPIWLVIDDEDGAEAEYRKRYGDQVLSFSKAEIAHRVDTADNFDGLLGVVFARCAVFDLAESVGATNFLVLDDDYTSFYYRFDADHRYGSWQVKSLDRVFDAMVRFLDVSGATSICLSQGGDHIGGGESHGLRAIRAKRKAMNTFFCRTDRRFDFYGRTNEDVNVYVREGHIGRLFLSLMSVQVNQVQTQSNAGGLTEIYLDRGTYVKSFYSVMFAPSCVKLATMGRVDRRLHHRVKWRNAVPMILREDHRKAAA